MTENRRNRLEADSAERRFRLTRWAPLLAVAVVAAGVALAVSSRYAAPESGVELDLSGRIAILPWVNATGDRADAWISLGLMEMVAETLARSPGVQVVSPERLRRAVELRGLSADDPGSRERIRELARALGGETLLDARMRKREASRLVGSGDTTYTVEFQFFDSDGPGPSGELTGPDPLAAARLLADSIARSLSRGGAAVRFTSVFSRDPFVDRLYAMGLQELRTSGADAAAPHFEIAIAARPRFLQAQARLAECRRELGDRTGSRQLALAVLDEAQGRGERRLQAWSLRALGRLSAGEGQFEAAEEHYSQAFSILLGLDEPVGRAELLSELARLALTRGENGRAEELLIELLDLRKNLGDRLGETDALLELGSLFLNGGDREGAKQTLLRARQLANGLDDLWTEMRAVASLGEVARRENDLETARDLWSQALVFYEQRGDRARQLLLTRNLSEVLLAAKDFEAAEDLLHEVVELASELENPTFEAAASLRLAWILLRTGYPLQARTHLDRTLELDRWIIDDRIDLQQVIAWFAYEQGNFRLAVNTLVQAKRQAEDQWSPWHQAFLEVFEEAMLAGRRLPLPGEKGYRAVTPAVEEAVVG